MCLAAGFAPAEGMMKLNLEKEDRSFERSVSTAVLSPKTKTYYYAAFSTDSIKQCEFMKETFSKGRLFCLI